MFIRLLATLLLLNFGLSSANASLINFKIDGALEDGGSFSGAFSYDKDAIDIAPSPIQDLFPLESWDVTVSLGGGQKFLFESNVPNPASGVVGIDPSPAQIFLHLGDPAGEIDPTRPTLQVVFQFLGPLPLTGVAPTRDDWGDFDPLLPGEVGIDSFFGWSEPGQPGPTNFISVIEASIPEPTILALIVVGLGGLGFARHRAEGSRGHV